MNKKLLIISIAVVLVLLVGTGLVVYSIANTHSASTTTYGSTSTQFPIGSVNTTGSNPSTGAPSGAGQLTVQTVQGTTLPVHNFKTDPGTTPDPSNAGSYYLSGGADATVSNAPYQIYYNKADGSFSITLYKEPLGHYRVQAQQELERKLGLNDTQLCNLKYFISAGPGVSELYSTENIGFSFCPGATQLPD